MKTLALTLALPMLLAACETVPTVTREGPPQDVEVLGRNWRVTQTAETPPTYRAARWLNSASYDPFGKPAEIKTTQAIRAIETATGCRVNRSSLYRDVSDNFYAQVICS
jgi:predicted small secreted protein